MDFPDSKEQLGLAYKKILRWRQEQLQRFESGHIAIGAKQYYSENPVAFINHWVDTYDPRNASSDTPARIPLLLFPKQQELVLFINDMMSYQQNGLIEKSRDMGATWVCCAYSAWLLLFKPGASVGWGSRKEQLVDKMGDPDSIFQKIRMIIEGLPVQFLPTGFNYNKHLAYMKITNPENGATITGEAGDNIGRGGRKSIFFKDEAAYYERPEKIEAALADNTRVQIDISSVNGIGNVFHRRREAGLEWSPGEVHKKCTNIFVMDWKDHPFKNQEWYEERKAKATADGLSHVFAQEVDRNYAAALEGTIIPHEWVLSAVDAHKTLGFGVEGGYSAGLDVADGGKDKNALAVIKGNVLLHLHEWKERDTALTARKTVDYCTKYVKGERLKVQYDCIGVGSGVKAEINNLRDGKKLCKNISFVPWDAGAKPENPDKHIISGDNESMLNRDFYANLKAQAWWELRRRFEKTHRAIHENMSYNTDELISISSDIMQLSSLKKELCQPTASKSGQMKLLIDKQPAGTYSPNLADAVVMAFWPANKNAYTLDNI